MMFSCPLALRPRSHLLAHLSLLQHIVALSVVTAIRTAPGYEELPVCIKWPNDIYYQNRVKLGGVLVSVFSASDPTSPTTAVIGCGVNVSNKYPTMSVNDCIQLHNNTTHSSSSTSSSSRGGGIILPPFTVEALLALSLNRLERYLSLYEHSGMSAIETDYYHYWLHKDAVVQLGSHANEEVTVRGIDQFGYLRVVTQTGEELNLRPDGNSFDIMNNLIVMK
ncbi:Biotin--protein ligase [Geodia barretti]|nr:Biotin--protein ligase [Geodia barretti]